MAKATQGLSPRELAYHNRLLHSICSPPRRTGLADNRSIAVPARRYGLWRQLLAADACSVHCFMATLLHRTRCALGYDGAPSSADHALAGRCHEWGGRHRFNACEADFRVDQFEHAIRSRQCGSQRRQWRAARSCAVGSPRHRHPLGAWGSMVPIWPVAACCHRRPGCARRVFWLRTTAPVRRPFRNARHEGDDLGSPSDRISGVVKNTPSGVGLGVGVTATCGPAPESSWMRMSRAKSSCTVLWQ